MSSSTVHRLVEAAAPGHFELARLLFEEYAAELGVDLSFQGFAEEVNSLPDRYAPPSGCLVLAMIGREAAGCGGLRRLSTDVCEMKRLYVRPGARGARLGRRLAEYLIDQGCKRGYDTMRLDTLASMAGAQSLYRSLGFREISPYYSNPLTGALYMELALGRTRGM
jgi:ribosomal protein S18 acetylase RimI-like enzyme